ncbi:MAG: RNA polymerase factor sigma-54 [Acidobacteriota bacterium]
MALEQKLSLKLAQKLVMTPSLQQAIKLLQMTRLELEGVLTQELVENPVLEETEPGTEEDQGVDAAEDAKELEQEALSDIDLDAYFSEYAESWEGSGAASVYEERQGPPLENTLTREDDLYDHLSWQLHMMNVSPLIREIAEMIIGNLEPDGFLAASVDEIRAMGADGWEERHPMFAEALAETLEEEASADGEPGSDEAEGGPLDAGELTTSGQGEAVSAWAEPIDENGAPIGATAEAAATDEAAAGDEGDDEEALDPELAAAVERGYPLAAVEEALALIRSLDPPGIACRDLRESLMCQLDRIGEPDDSLARRLVDEKWDLFTRRKFEQIAKDFGIPLQKLKPVVEVISGLDTRPGRKYDTDSTQYVEPDVHIVKVGEEYVIQLNDNGLPRLRVSRAYRRMLQEMRKEGSEAEAQQYIKEKMRSAMWLIKSLDQRQRTIYKVADSIIKQQRAFLDHGVDHLKPMVLRDVAEDIEMHESTVSRVVSNKYMHTPRGLLAMKFFFHSGIDREYGGDISSLTVKRKIQNLVQDEDPKKPLSDSALMRILNREGIHIARRTVAKYRDELSIPSSTERKRIF